MLVYPNVQEYNKDKTLLTRTKGSRSCLILFIFRWLTRYFIPCLQYSIHTARWQLAQLTRISYQITKNAAYKKLFPGSLSRIDHAQPFMI